MHPLKEKCYWVFDLDGTLTKPVHDFDHIRSVLGIAPQADILSTIETLPRQKKCTMLEQLDVLERYYAAQAEPADGVIDLLNHLTNRGCKLGILTRNTKELALLSLGAIGAGDFFEPEMVLGRDEASPKPSPDGINILLNQWAAGLEKSVMVGDYQYDLMAGRSAAVMTVHVDTDPRGWPEVTDVRVQNLIELFQLVN